MNTSPDLAPSDAVLKAVIEQILRPTMEQISRDAGIELAASVSIWNNATEVCRFSMEHGSSEAKTAGEIRLRFRTTFNPKRLLLRAEAIFDNPRLASGFSGFTLKGQITINGQVNAERKAWTVRYNVWDWML